MKRVAVGCLLLASCAVPVRTTISPDGLLTAVLKAEVDRDAAAPALPVSLGHSQTALRVAALRAVARTAEVGTSSLATGLLGDREPEVAKWAAFALGQIGDTQAEAALLAALGTVATAPEQVLLALGRAGTATSAREVASRLDDPRASVRGAAALALGLMAKRLGPALPGERYAPKLAGMIKDPEREVRFGAVYALMRIGGSRAAVALVPALADADPEIRANAARGLGAAHAAPYVLDSVADDPDWRVRVERLRALGAIGQASPAESANVAARLAAAVPREFARLSAGGTVASGTALHSLLAVVKAAQQIGPEGARVLALLEKTPWSTDQLRPESISDLARLACAVAAALDEAESTVRRVRACGDASLPAWRREQLAARLYAHQGNDAAVAALAQLAGHQDPRVRLAAVEGLGEVERETAVQVLVRLLDSNDLYVVSAAADQLARPDRARFRPAGLAERLRAALHAAVKQPDAGYAISILDAIGALGEPARALLPELEALAADARAPIRRRAARAREALTGKPVAFGPPGPTPLVARPAPRRDAVKLEITTARGRILLLLDGALAPSTTGVLVSLAESGFYTDRSFHRVVSDFVAQAGCPRGDGYGGPGYTIEDEVSPEPFVRGALGIATSGRDTGGSQFFIMHSAHPHLDGGYAVVGRVLEGMEVVDALQEDDRMMELRVLEDGGSPRLQLR